MNQITIETLLVLIIVIINCLRWWGGCFVGCTTMNFIFIVLCTTNLSSIGYRMDIGFVLLRLLPASIIRQLLCSFHSFDTFFRFWWSNMLNVSNLIMNRHSIHTASLRYYHKSVLLMSNFTLKRKQNPWDYQYYVTLTVNNKLCNLSMLIWKNYPHLMYRMFVLLTLQFHLKPNVVKTFFRSNYQVNGNLDICLLSGSFSKICIKIH